MLSTYWCSWRAGRGVWMWSHIWVVCFHTFGWGGYHATLSYQYDSSWSGIVNGIGIVIFWRHPEFLQSTGNGRLQRSCKSSHSTMLSGNDSSIKAHHFFIMYLARESDFQTFSAATSKLLKRIKRTSPVIIPTSRWKSQPLLFARSLQHPLPSLWWARKLAKSWWVHIDMINLYNKD